MVRLILQPRTEFVVMNEHIERVVEQISNDFNSLATVVVVPLQFDLFYFDGDKVVNLTPRSV